jgi:quercetin dioxygenase-like cupin family protein
MRRGMDVSPIEGFPDVVRFVRYAPHRVMPQHAHDDAGISLVIAGQLVEESRHGSVTARPGDVVLKPAGTSHQNRFGPNGATLIAVVVRAPSADRETLE